MRCMAERMSGPGETPDAELLARVPTVLAAVRAGGDPHGEESFEHGLAVLIAGTEAALRR